MSAADTRRIALNVLEGPNCGEVGGETLHSLAQRLLATLDELERLTVGRATLEDQTNRAELAEANLRHFGRHVPPCPRWITSGSPEMNPCLCGFDDVLAGDAVLSGGGERAPVDGYALGMRESRPDVCWRLLEGDHCCIQDRGHDDGIHEPTPVLSGGSE